MSVGPPLQGLSVSLSSTGVSIVTATLYFSFAGESLLNVGVSLVTAIATAQFSGTVFQFNNVSETQYIPFIVGFP